MRYFSAHPARFEGYGSRCGRFDRRGRGLGGIGGSYGGLGGGIYDGVGGGIYGGIGRGIYSGGGGGINSGVMEVSTVA